MLHLRYKFRTKSTLELVKLAQDGVQEATNFVVERYYPMVLKISGKYYPQWGEKEDLIQNGLVGILKAIYYYKFGKSSFTSFVWKSIDSEIKSFLTYLNRMKNKMLTDSIKLDMLIDENIEDKLSDFGYEQNIMDGYMLEEFMKECREILSDEEFEIFEMHLQRIPYKDISKISKRNTKYVDNTLQKIKRKTEAIVKMYELIRTRIVLF